MGGETVTWPLISQCLQGLSPRGRGNRGPRRDRGATLWSIPAWAGKPFVQCRPRAPPKVYPRVGGETTVVGPIPCFHYGLSPRGRGNHERPHRLRLAPRSIPAWAGKPTAGSTVTLVNRVYPRVGGETLTGWSRCRSAAGLSPRGRGNLDPRLGLSLALGSIPAWAGKPHNCSRIRRTCEVYPRVGGETQSGPRAALPGNGLSPRGRGNRWVQVYPRVGGETTNTAATWGTMAGLSPRGRGNQHHLFLQCHRLRSIPAWAGKPPQDVCVAMAGSIPACLQRIYLLTVYPRVGGETPPSGKGGSIPACFCWGLSPRGRGNPVARHAGRRPLGSIPAWAGKPRKLPS